MNRSLNESIVILSKAKDLLLPLLSLFYLSSPEENLLLAGTMSRF
jgi:hypothetical protein